MFQYEGWRWWLLIANVLSANSGGGGGPGRTGKVRANCNNNEPDFLLHRLEKCGMFSKNFYFRGRGLGNKGDGLISWFILYHLSPRIKSPITLLQHWYIPRGWEFCPAIYMPYAHYQLTFMIVEFNIKMYNMIAPWLMCRTTAIAELVTLVGYIDWKWTNISLAWWVFAGSLEKFRIERNARSSFLGSCLYIVLGCIVICKVASFGGVGFCNLALSISMIY